MKWLLDIIEKLQPHFGEKGRFSRWYPLFEAVENFLFSSSATTTTTSHVRDPLDLKRYMSMVIVGLLPCTVASVYFFGLRVIAVIIVSYVVGGMCEVLFAVLRKEKINEGFLVTGLIFPLILPPGIPLWLVALGVAFGVIIGKELFGGTGRNLFNPALVGRCFLAIGYPAVMASGWFKPGSGVTGRLFQWVDKTSVDVITSATPLGMARQGTFSDIHNLFLGMHAGTIGETSALAILIGGLFLVVTRVANWRIVAGILIGVALLEGTFHYLHPATFGTVLWHISAGGLLFGAFFMATDPVTGPATKIGKWIFGLFIGIVTILIRNFSGYVEGVMFAILFGNIIAPLIDEIVFSIQLKRPGYEKK